MRLSLGRLQQPLQPQPPEPLQLVLPLLPVVLPPRERRQEPELPAAMPPAARAVPLLEVEAPREVALARAEVRVRVETLAAARLPTSMPSTKSLKICAQREVTLRASGAAAG